MAREIRTSSESTGNQMGRVDVSSGLHTLGKGIADLGKGVGHVMETMEAKQADQQVRLYNTEMENRLKIYEQSLEGIWDEKELANARTNFSQQSSEYYTEAVDTGRFNRKAEDFISSKLNKEFSDSADSISTARRKGAIAQNAYTSLTTNVDILTNNLNLNGADEAIENGVATNILSPAKGESMKWDARSKVSYTLVERDINDDSWKDEYGFETLEELSVALDDRTLDESEYLTPTQVSKLQSEIVGVLREKTVEQSKYMQTLDVRFSPNSPNPVTSDDLEGIEDPLEKEIYSEKLKNQNNRIRLNIETTEASRAKASVKENDIFYKAMAETEIGKGEFKQAQLYLDKMTNPNSKTLAVAELSTDEFKFDASASKKKELKTKAEISENDIFYKAMAKTKMDRGDYSGAQASIEKMTDVNAKALADEELSTDKFKLEAGIRSAQGVLSLSGTKKKYTEYSAPWRDGDGKSLTYSTTTAQHNSAVNIMLSRLELKGETMNARDIIEGGKKTRVLTGVEAVSAAWHEINAITDVDLNAKYTSRLNALKSEISSYGFSKNTMGMSNVPVPLIQPLTDLDKEVYNNTSGFTPDTTPELVQIYSDALDYLGSTYLADPDYFIKNKDIIVEKAKETYNNKMGELKLGASIDRVKSANTPKVQKVPDAELIKQMMLKK